MTQSHPWQKLKNFFHKIQAIWANIRYGFPYQDLKIIGVTGTDGKTTTTSLIYHILKTNKLPVGYISTIKAKIGDQELDTGLHVTTPDPWVVPKYLSMMRAAGIKYVVLESTSSGLQQNRLWGIEFDAATITNIKSDHLDYHETWENYAVAKFKVIEKLKANGLGVLNRDDENTRNWLITKMEKSKTSLQIVWYSKYEVKELTQTIAGLSFTYKDTAFTVPLIGDYNLENTLAAINIASKYLPLDKIAKALKTFTTPMGRMEIIQKQPLVIIIDFAHTPHALAEALKAVKSINTNSGRIITVFGCAGKRDKSRREMGKVSAEMADITILTAEDPRTEKLAQVNDEILGHALKVGGKLVTRYANHTEYLKDSKLKQVKIAIHDALNLKNKPIFAFDEDSIQSRIDALDFALKLAQRNDIIFITGKAHEQSLAFGNTEYPWSDHKAVRELLSDKPKK